jgi:hypothetical protein
MLTRAVKARLADDLQLWVADGQISTDTAAKLRERYQAAGFGWVTVVKYLGVGGGVMAFFGVLGLVSAMVGSEGFAGGVLIAVGGGLMAAGIALSRDLRNRYAFSSRAVTALGAMALAGGVAVIAKALDCSDGATALVTGAVAVPLYAFLAYRLRDGFLLVLALLGFFHWVGSWTSMFGRSSYELDIEQPKVMAAVALAVFAAGLWHQKHEVRFLRFYVVYQALALSYLNLSLLILSIWNHPESTAPWIAVFTAVALAQIVLGARLHSGLVLGFGVTAAALDLFTRYYEQFWDQLSLGAFLALGGAVLLGFGLGFERWNQGREGSAP